MNRFSRNLEYLWKVAVSGAAFSIAGTVGAGLAMLAGFHTPATPAGMNVQRMQFINLATSPSMGLALAPLALGLLGSYWARACAIALFVFISLGVNTTIEAKIFSTLYANGGIAFSLVMYAAGAIAFGALLAGLLRGTSFDSREVVRRTSRSWTWRTIVAVLAFPVIYFVFGATIAPLVLPTYRAGVAGLVIPPLSVILPVQVLRSALFLLSSLPLILLWKQSRRSLVLALGLALTWNVGLYGLLSATCMPTLLRVIHSIEIAADSFVCAMVTVMLLRPAMGSSEPATNAQEPKISTVTVATVAGNSLVH